MNRITNIYRDIEKLLTLKELMENHSIDIEINTTQRKTICKKKRRKSNKKRACIVITKPSFCFALNAV